MRKLLILGVMCARLSAQPAAGTAAPPSAPDAVTAEPWLTGSIDIGYRWVSGIGGSADTYRSIVDLGSGPKLTATEFTLLDPKKRLFDRVDVRAYNWGDDPSSSFRLDAKKARLYDFSADYRNIAYYNNLPAYADPLLATTGKALDEQSLDTRQRLGTYRLDLLPGSRIVPYLVYERSADNGTGVATFVSGDDEFPVASLTRNSTNNYRGGVRLEFSLLHVTLEQGGTTYKDDQQLSQGAGANAGNFTAPVFGQKLNLTTLDEIYGVRGNSYYSKGQLNANVNSWLDFYGQFLFSQPNSTVNYQQFDTGNQVLLSQLLFYTGEQGIVAAEAKLPHTSGSLGAELRPLKRVRVIPSWLTDRMHTNSSDAMRQSLTNATGTTAIAEALSSALATNYSEAGVDAAVELTRKITVHGGYRHVWGNASDATLPASGLVYMDQGTIRRNVGLAGLTWKPVQRVSVSASFEGASSTGTYFRTSLYNYRKVRLRGHYQVARTLSLAASLNLLSNRNPNAGIGYSFLSHQESASLTWTPAKSKRWDFQGSYTRSTLRSDIGFLDPEYLTPEQSFYRDNSHTATALFDANLPLRAGLTAKVSLGGSLFVSSGSNPTRFYQPMGRLAVPFSRHVAWISEWRYYGFGEPFYLYQGFRAETFTTGLRLTR